MQKKFSIIGYGSLLSHKSLKEDLPRKQFIPVIIKGYKRIFNILDPKTKKDILNVAPFKKSYFNGILFEVTEKELTKFKKEMIGIILKKLNATILQPEKN